MNLIKPIISKVDRIVGDFTTSTVEYNASNVTYSSTTVLYGGSDRVYPVLANIESVEIIKPNIQIIK